MDAVPCTSTLTQLLLRSCGDLEEERLTSDIWAMLAGSTR
jgi:hypothetical protein